jgi:hemoglobin
MENNANEKSLYERLGGTEGITAIATEVIEAHMVNPDIKARFLPLKDDPEHLAEVRKHVIDFFVMGSGGPQQYSGKDMHAAHVGMNINQGEYMCVMDDIMSTLDKNNIDEQSKKDVLAIIYSLKDQMIGV